MTYLDSIILGLLQGLTEFLPVSSSGHLELGAVFLNIQGTDNLLFSVIVHGATALSTIVVFRKDIATLLVEGISLNYRSPSTRYLLILAVSMIPVGLIGVLWESEIESFFGGKTIFVASMLMITSILLTIAHVIDPGKKEVNYLRGFIIGIAQAFALLPGISRSGATISAALILGVEREKAARFSFLMVLVPILGATALKIKDLMEAPAGAANVDIGILITGFLTAFISGLLACSWMIKLVKQGKLIWFALYCFILATTVMIAYW